MFIDHVCIQYIKKTKTWNTLKKKIKYSLLEFKTFLIYLHLVVYFCVTKSCPTLVIPWTVALHALLSMGFPKQEHWNELLFPSPGNLRDPGNQTCVSCIGRQNLYPWATRKAHLGVKKYIIQSLLDSQISAS